MLYIIPTDTCYGIACPFYDKEAYQRIYNLKKRSFDKPLAILVESFSWLEKNTDISKKQLEFLSAYPYPFTVLLQSSPVRAYLQFSTEDEEAFINKDIYTYISFRVAHHPVHKKLLAKTGPLWLTSANISKSGETYTSAKILEDFGYQIQTGEVEFHDVGDLDPSVAASNVFSFQSESCELEFIRKNY